MGAAVAGSSHIMTLPDRIRRITAFLEKMAHAIALINDDKVPEAKAAASAAIAELAKPKNA